MSSIHTNEIEQKELKKILAGKRVEAEEKE